MPAPRHATKRDESEPEIVKALRQMGVTVYLLDTPVDLLLGFRNKTYLAECKTGSKGYGKALNKNQQGFADNWRGGSVAVFRTPQDAVDWVNER
ncbi:MAG: hypothetical protein GY941_24560 [Planctomycetes bacterium]|nr:hypothetical protein [Planctomycetota bacterium]